MTEPKKRIAVLVRDRQAESLRMSVGLTVLGDIVDVYVIDVLLERGAHIDMSIEALSQMGGSIFTNKPDNPFEKVTTEDVARRLTEYDVIVPY